MRLNSIFVTLLAGLLVCAPYALYGETEEAPQVIELMKQNRYEGYLVIGGLDPYNKTVPIMFKYPTSYVEDAYHVLALELNEKEPEGPPLLPTSNKYLIPVALYRGNSSNPYPDVPERQQPFPLIPLRLDYKITAVREGKEIVITKIWHLVTQVPGLKEINKKYNNWSENRSFSEEFNIEIGKQINYYPSM
jgi:hypothetical protein